MRPPGVPPADRPPGDGEEGGRIGPFPGWGWLYTTVIVYTALLILLLYLLTRWTDYGP